MDTSKNKLIQSLKYWLGQSIFTTNAIQPIRTFVGIEPSLSACLVCRADNGEDLSFSQGMIVLKPISEMTDEDAKQIMMYIFPEISSITTGDFNISKQEENLINIQFIDKLNGLIKFVVNIDENFNISALETSKENDKVLEVNLCQKRQVKNDAPYIWIMKFFLDNGYGAIKMESSPTGWVDLFGTPCASFSDENVKEQVGKTVSYWKQLQNKK